MIHPRSPRTDNTGRVDISESLPYADDDTSDDFIPLGSIAARDFDSHICFASAFPVRRGDDLPMRVCEFTVYDKCVSVRQVCVRCECGNGGGWKALDTCK